MAETKIEYFGKNDLLYLCNLISGELAKYVLAVEGKGLSANDFTDELKTKLDGINLALYATLNSPEFTGTPTAPTATEGTNSTQIATTAFTMSAINKAMSEVVSIKFDGPYANYADMVSKVTNPRQGTIYLVTNSGSVPNANDEYFWNGTSFELFGTTALDLSGYLKIADITELTQSEINAVWNSVFDE